MKYALILLITFLTFSCTPRKLKLVSIETGTGFNDRCSLSGKDMVFTFKQFNKNGTVKDLFNFLYFSGDTLCFTVELNRTVAPHNIHVFFTDISSGREFKAERIEVHDNLVCGFSLVGTIMEQLYRDELHKPVPKNMYCCGDIPFGLRIQIAGSNNEIYSEIRSSFRIKYISSQ